LQELSISFIYNIVTVKQILIFTFKVLAFIAIFSSLYYFFILKSQILLKKEKLELVSALDRHKSLLTQNRLAYVELAKLDPKSSIFNDDKSNVIGHIQDSNKKGSEISDSFKPLAKEPGFNQKITDLFKDSKQIYIEQNSLLDKVFTTKSYGDGLKILKSDESVALLTRQTNLILQYDFLIKQIQGSNKSAK